jgi:hypothetical protein
MSSSDTEQEKRSPEELSKLADAKKVLQDPESVAPINFSAFGRRIAEIITSALRRGPSAKAASSPSDRPEEEEKPRSRAP